MIGCQEGAEGVKHDGRGASLGSLIRRIEKRRTVFMIQSEITLGAKNVKKRIM